MAFQKAVKGTVLVGGGALATILGLSQFAHYKRKQVSNCTHIDYNMKLKSKSRVWGVCRLMALFRNYCLSLICKTLI